MNGIYSCHGFSMFTGGVYPLEMMTLKEIYMEADMPLYDHCALNCTEIQCYFKFKLNEFKCPSQNSILRFNDHL